MTDLSVFNLLSKNGVVSFLSFSVASGSLYRSMGRAKLRLNLFKGPRKRGLRNSKIDHNSESLFSTGVPVRAILFWALN